MLEDKLDCGRCISDNPVRTCTCVTVDLNNWNPARGVVDRWLAMETMARTDQQAIDAARDQVGYTLFFPLGIVLSAHQQHGQARRTQGLLDSSGQSWKERA
jgi:hypothetical protein